MAASLTLNLVAPLGIPHVRDGVVFPLNPSAEVLIPRSSECGYLETGP